MSRLPSPFGPFEPIRRLGAGGMAETFVAVRRGPGDFEQHVCIKRILPAFESDREFVDSFLREARTSAALRHANIVQVLDFGVAEGAHYLALELVEGLDLRALLGDSSQRRALDPELATLITADVGAALEHAHAGEAGRMVVVHRDVSPSNVLVSRAGEVKLTDFGIARAIGSSHRTATGIIKGKLPYMPPEYIEGQPFDERGDLFSLGVMLYELLIGRRPFDGESDMDTIRRIALGSYTPVHELRPEIPEQLSLCVERLLAREPGARFGSARELLDALPSLATHRVRRRLAQLVRAQMGALDQPADPLAGTLAASQPPTSGAPEEPSQRVPTRPLTPSAPLSQRRGPSRRALLTLALASLGLLGVLGAALMRASSAPSPQPAPPPARAEPALLSPPHSASSAREDLAAPAAPPSSPQPLPSGEESGPGAQASAVSQREPAELKVVVYPFGDVWVDGKRLGQSPVTVKLAPGVHELGVGDGRPREHRTIRLSPGQRERLEIKRRDLPDAP